jgi:hypothetical protein
VPTEEIVAIEELARGAAASSTLWMVLRNVPAGSAAHWPNIVRLVRKLGVSLHVIYVMPTGIARELSTFGNLPALVPRPVLVHGAGMPDTNQLTLPALCPVDAALTRSFDLLSR